MGKRLVRRGRCASKLLFFAATCVLVSCQSSTSKPGGTATQPVGGSVAVSSTVQSVIRSSRTDGQVSVSGVEVPAGGGFVAVYDDAGGVPGPLLGSSKKLPAGRTVGEVVAAEGSGGVWLIAIRDVDGDGLMSFPSPDVPVTDPKTGSVVSVFVASSESSTKGTK